MSKKIKHLVVDTNAFVKGTSLQDIAENIYTVQDVVDEITNDRQRRKLVVLPYDLKIKDVFTENIKFISDFSKKTGDYKSLSATDIQVMALTYQLEKEIVGSEHLKKEPTMQKTTNFYGVRPKTDTNDANQQNNLTNSTTNSEVENSENKEDITDTDKTAPNSEESYQNNPNETSHMEENPTNATSSSEVKNGENKEDITDTDKTAPNSEESNQNNVDETPHVKEKDTNDDEIAEQVRNMDLNDEKEADEGIEEASDEESDTADSKTQSDDSDGGEWITPNNYKQKQKEIEHGVFEDKNVEVACMTSDFAMQNVMKHIGLNVTSSDGRVIKQIRTFIFRCTACFKTTSIMTKIFCPKCGNATLKKVSVSVDEQGNQHIHINARKPLSAKGKRYSLPTPRGGQHFQYPIVTEDQHIKKSFATKLGRKKTDALDPDYTAGFSPFVMRDLNSRSAVLGVRANRQDIKFLMKHSKGKKK